MRCPYGTCTASHRRFGILVLALVLQCVAAGKDFYAILEVARSADDAAIKRSYRKLSLKYHPDKNKDADAKDRFADVARAYEVLSDAKLRRVYDQQGEEGLNRHEQRQGQGQHQQDFFSQMFGGQRGGGDVEHKGPGVEVDLEVSLEDIFLGKQLEMLVRKQKLCRQCGGSGARNPGDMHVCGACGGSGTRIVRQQVAPGFIQQMQTTCNKCGGKGKTISHPCPTCRGTKVTLWTDSVHVEVERGSPDGHKIKFEHGSDEHPDHAAGDLVFSLCTLPHKVFRREGNDLRMTMVLSLGEALLGFSRDLQHLDGRTVTVSDSGTTQHGRVRRVKGEGMPEHNFASNRGDLLVDFEVEMPRALTAEQKDALRKILPSGPPAA